MTSTDYDSPLQQSSSPSAHQQQANGCSFLFVQTSSLSTTCTGLDDCEEPAVWCWPQSCSQGADQLVSCSINSTAHYCVCSNLLPTFETEPEEVGSTFVTAVPEDLSSSWPGSASSNATMSSNWYSSSDSASGSGTSFHQTIEEAASSMNNQQFAENDGLPVGAIAAIVVVSFLVAVALIALSVWSLLKLKRKRKLEGKYCPAVEEQKSSANTLPPLPLPAPEGLI